MNTKVLALILGLAVLASLGSFYLSKTPNSVLDHDYKIMNDQFYSYLDSDELKQRVNLFKDWINVYGKQYSATEAPMRFYAWNKNYEFVQDHNSQNLSWTVEMNQFADLSVEEFSSLYLGYNADQYNHEEEAKHADVENPDLSNLAASKDWRTEGAVTKVKNQGSCGGCYAFASAGALEALYKFKKDKLKALSPQQIIDCSGSNGNQGCNGGLMTYSFTYTKSNGIESNTAYPYKGRAGSCTHSSSKSLLKNNDYKTITTYAGLKSALQNQPVAVAVQAGSGAIQLYKSGIIKSNCGTALDHAILAVGYGTQSSTEYWIVKNSWGSSWGESGYLRIQTGTQNSGKGLCGINSQASYPTQ